jgi:hypothetical protein
VGEVARGGDAGDGAVGEPLDVADARERPPDRGPRDWVVDEAGDFILARPERRQVQQRLTEPAPQEAGAHRGLRLVQDGEEAVELLAAPALGQLQVAAGLRVERHEAVDGVGGKGGDLVDPGELGVLQVGEQGAGGADGQRLAGHAESVERADPEEGLECLGGAVGTAPPCLNRAQADPVGEPGPARQGHLIGEPGRQHHLGRVEAEEFAAHRQERLFGEAAAISVVANSPVEMSA